MKNDQLYLDIDKPATYNLQPVTYNRNLFD